MTKKSDKVEGFVRECNDREISLINLRTAHFAKWLYFHYEPTKFSPHEDFWSRLGDWLDNVSTIEEKKTLFHLLHQIHFIGPDEFEECYRTAFNCNVANWIINQCDIDPFSDDATQKIAEEIQKTWFCPITDSFRINAFYHVNNIDTSANLRPDWNSLSQLGAADKIELYCQNNNINKIVLLEDFVGGGSQAKNAIRFACNLSNSINVTFIPMIICPDGEKLFSSYANSINSPNTKPKLTIQPILKLAPSIFINDTLSPASMKSADADAIRQLAYSTYNKVSGNFRPGNNKPYHPFGFPPDNPTGGLIVMYSNTPDNTIPMIHWSPRAGTWKPLFPRHSRV
jgi:hypothetical protein